MTVRRGTLYSGVFLIAAGAALLGVAVGVLDANAIATAVGTLWPLAVIAAGRRAWCSVAHGPHWVPGFLPPW